MDCVDLGQGRDINMSHVSISAGQKLAPELSLDAPTNSYLGAALFVLSLMSQT